MDEQGPGLFRLLGVSVEAAGRPILDSVDLVIPEGCLTVLAGPSGSGKTTLLRLLDRLDVPTSGSIWSRGRRLDDIDPLALRRDVAMVFQQPPVFPGTVAENLLAADPGLGEQEVVDALVRVELTAAHAGQDAATLSVGEAQRLCFARALLTSPSVVLADEPTSALDEVPKRALEELARGLVDGGLSVVWVSHEPQQVRRIADHAVVLEQGRVVAAGSLQELIGSANDRVLGFMDGRS